MCETFSPCVSVYGRYVIPESHASFPYGQEILRPALPTTSEFPVFSPGSKQGEPRAVEQGGDHCVLLCVCA